MAITEKVRIKQVLQTGLVVKDLQKAMERYCLGRLPIVTTRVG